MSSLWSQVNPTAASGPVAAEDVASQSSAKQADAVAGVTESPGGLSLTEGSAGGLGRHLGVVSCTLLIVGRIIGTGIFSTPSSILSSTGSVGASLLLWVLGFILSFCGLFIWLEFGTMFPKSGGEKVYLEAVYTRPKYLVTIIFAANAILLGFTASGCIVFASNILVAAGKTATTWSERGIALGVIFFVTILHGLTPQTGVRLMNILTVFKIAILVFIVVSGWVVLSGKTSVKDPHANFHNAFVGSSTSSNNVCPFLPSSPTTYTSRSLYRTSQLKSHGRGVPMDLTTDYSMQRPHSKSSMLTRVGPTSTTCSTTSVILSKHLKLQARLAWAYVLCCISLQMWRTSLRRLRLKSKTRASL